MIKVGLSYPAFFNLFKNVFPTLELIRSPEDAKNYDLILFPGGEDVSPSFYSEDNRYSSCTIERDKFEKEVYSYAVRTGKKLLGICRGSQFLNVMRGGDLYQDLTYQVGRGHAALHGYNRINNHKILSVIPDVINSTHHQGIKHTGRDMRIIIEHKDIPEVTVSTDGTMLLMQFHPEMMGGCKPLFSYIEEWVGSKEAAKVSAVDRPIVKLKTLQELAEEAKEKELEERKKKQVENMFHVGFQWVPEDEREDNH